MIIQNYFNFGNSSFVVHFKLDQTGVLFFWVTRYIDVICESRLQQIVHTVKLTKRANMITLKGSFIVQSQKLVTAYTRPQVRIVIFYFTVDYNIKQNTTMNANRSQKHGPILHYITQAKSKTT